MSSDLDRSHRTRVTVCDAFEKRVAASRDAIAIRDGERSFTYGWLDDRANGLAVQLQARGVVRGSVVAVTCTECANVLVALAAILKAGGAYLPLDASDPSARNRLMMSTANAVAVVADGPLTFTSPCTIVDGSSVDQSRKSVRKVDLTGVDLAYVMYTSGSTGQPKGVLVPHEAITRLVVDCEYVDFQSTDQIAQVAHIGFDAATFEIWGALLNGATLCAFDKGTILNSTAFSDRLKQEQVTVMFLTSALFSQVVADHPDAFGGLRFLLVGGDVVSANAASAVLQSSPPDVLMNAYGPTETTTFATTYRLPSSWATDASIPIGRAIDQTSIAIWKTRR